MNLFRARSFRLVVVVIAGAAWLAISNHCVLAAVGGGNMPMSCHGDSPAKHGPKSSVECCKILRATLLVCVSNLIAPPLRSTHDFPLVILSATELLRPVKLIEWDTGPPGAGSFAELVLQRSVLAHAPPFVA